MKQKLLLLFLFWVGLAVSSYAQKTITGKVTDNTGNPIPSASVVEKGTTNGTITDIDGNYSLTTKGDNPTVLISLIGHSTQEVAVSGQTTINVSLLESALRLDDVVVVGYGQQKKATLTGSVNQFNNQDLNRRQVSSPSQLLQGLAPGLTAWQNSGKPGADGAAAIRIRGTGSINAGQAPLIVVDGVVSSLDYLDPNVIESITVLKDAASTAIYGVRGSNGVILVKTKRSAKNGIKLTYNGFLSQQSVTNIPERVSALEHIELSNLAQQNSTGNPAAFVFAPALVDKYRTQPADNIEVFNTNWVDLLLSNSGLMQNHNLILDAGSDKMSLLTSITLLDQQGLTANTSYRKLDIRMNPDIKLTDKLHLTGNFFFNNGKAIEPAGSTPEFIIRQAIGLPANAAAKLGEGQYGDAGQSNRRNPLGQAEASGTRQEIVPVLRGQANLEYKPVTGLTLTTSYSREQWMPNTKSFQKSFDSYNPNVATKTWDFVSRYPGTNRLSETYGLSYRNTFLAQAAYERTFGKSVVKAMAGYQAEDFRAQSINAVRTDFPNENLPYISLGGANRDNSGTATEFALAGYFGRLNYTFADKYIIEVNGRYDGSSRFSQALDKQWDFFPSASAAWVFTEEGFLKGNKILDFGKIRGSWGQLGNQELGDNYPFAATYTPNTNYYFNGITNLGFSLTEAVNQGITWERSEQTNVGIDLSFLKGSLSLTADYYVKTISDMIFRKPIPSYLGLSPAYLNSGSMENRGWELSLTYKNRIGKFKYNVTAFLSDVQNKVTSLPTNDPTKPTIFDEGILRSIEGQPLRSFFGYKSLGFYQSAEDIASSPTTFFTPKPGDIKYADLNGDGKVNADDRTFIGNSFPRYEYSFNLNLEYGVFDMNALFQGVGKKETYLTGTGAYPFFAADFVPSLLAIHKDSWTPTNPNATFPRLLPAIGINGTNSSFWVRDAAYLRLKNVSLGARLPTKWAKMAGIQNARLYVSGQNLFTQTKLWKGFDPELPTHNAQFYPLMKTYTVGVNIGFK